MEQTLNVEKIRSFLEKNQQQNHPILDHPLEKHEEYVQKLYIDMLCVFAQYENGGTASALNFVQRLMAGLKLTEPVTEHSKAAMELSVERFSEFLHQCQENGLEDMFLLDAMLVSCAAGAPKKKQLEFLAQTADALNLPKSRVEWLSRLACVILEQDSEAYQGLCNELPRDFRNEFLTQIICYLKQFVVGVLIDTEELLYLYAPEKRAFDLTSYGNVFTNSNVIFENMILEADSRINNYKSLTFKNNSDVQIRNCEFRRYYFSFSNVQNITLTGSEFAMDPQNIYKFIDLANDTRLLTIDSCFFHNICTEKEWWYCTLISAYDNKNKPMCVMQNTKFVHIVKVGRDNSNIVIMCNSRVRMADCQFIDCTGEYGARLFYGCTIEKNEDCSFRNCAPLTN